MRIKPASQYIIWSIVLCSFTHSIHSFIHSAERAHRLTLSSSNSCRRFRLSSRSCSSSNTSWPTSAPAVDAGPCSREALAEEAGQWDQADRGSSRGWWVCETWSSSFCITTRASSTPKCSTSWNAASALPHLHTRPDRRQRAPLPPPHHKQQ